MVDEWVRATDTGDRAELGELPEDSPLWHDVAATSETCLGTTCPQYHECFVTRMRQRAAESDLVVVNHHLLCADAAVRQSAYGEVIPDCRYAVVDEAHQLEDVATQYFGIAVSNYRVEELVRDGERALNLGGLDDPEGALRRGLVQVDDDARTFFGSLGKTGRASVAGTKPAKNTPGLFPQGAEDRVRLRPDSYGDVLDEGLAVVASLDTLAAAMAVRAGGGATPGAEANEDAAALARRAAEIRDDLRFLLQADDASYVYFLEARGRGVFLRAAPIDVSAIVRALLLDRLRATVLTSATLAVDGSFEYLRSRLGITDAAELRVPSEFDFASQAVLYLPRGMPPPRAPEYAAQVAREVTGLLRCTRGRAFVLFTSYAMLRAVRELVEGRLPYPLLVQGTATRRALLEQFRSTPHAVLLATSSFWQGVDVAGEQLSAVIIDKLPFASPADPITSARIEALTADGRDAFQDYQVPLAVLTLQQGLGRLIRHRTDRGVLAVLDPRVRTMAYGERFLQACPPAPVIENLDEVARFMARE
jgi:ATP-dependent DNA helicase DinG